MTAEGPLLPGATLGVLGGGQLGRMFVLAARVMGYATVVLDPDPDSPAGRLADIHLKADYGDAVALLRMGSLCQAVTTEFENVPAAGPPQGRRSPLGGRERSELGGFIHGR